VPESPEIEPETGVAVVPAPAEVLLVEFG